MTDVLLGLAVILLGIVLLWDHRWQLKLWELQQQKDDEILTSLGFVIGAARRPEGNKEDEA